MKRGFSLMEVLVVLGIALVVAGFSLISGLDSISRSVVHSERDTLVTILTSARTKSLANVNAVPHGVRIDATDFTLFEGPAYVAGASGNRLTARTAAVSITGVSLPLDIVFTQLSATTSSAVSLALSDGAGNQSVTVNSEGRIDW
jgi:prepilin-type N-terminal cleavage/methylation domain-containing protein